TTRTRPGRTPLPRSSPRPSAAPVFAPAFSSRCVKTRWRDSTPSKGGSRTCSGTRSASSTWTARAGGRRFSGRSRRSTATRPAAAGGEVEIEPELVELVLDEVSAGKLDVGGAGRAAAAPRDGRIETPYLQLVLQRLWETERSAGSRTLRAETLRGLGGAEQ